MNWQKLYESHGVVFDRKAGNQLVGDCPFCGKKNHFYCHEDKGLWDCKVCGKRGGPSKMLEELASIYTEAFLENEAARKAIYKDRGIPTEIMKRWRIGWNGRQYTFPVRNENGNVCDIRLFTIGRGMISTAGAKVGLMGIEKIKQDVQTVYICEGEWDAMALDWLGQTLGKKLCVVGVPGASVFKKEWAQSFRDKDVVLLYDKDEAGDNGERTAMAQLTGVAKSIRYVHWPVDVPSGFDVRDWVRYGIKISKPMGCWKNLHKLFKAEPRKQSLEEKEAAHQESGPKKQISNKELFQTFTKWLHCNEDEPDALKVTFGTCFANRIAGDPVWVFLVGPPGSMKSEVLMSLSKHPSTYATTSLTPHALVSGAPPQNGRDPSLLPQLNNKMLICKDFTTILTMQYTQRDEILGILRDIFDGETTKVFGTGVSKSYKSRFGVLAGVTSKIEVFNNMHQSLGERFLKFRLMDEDHTGEAERIMRALSNISKEVQMKEELSDAATRVLNRDLPNPIPTIPKEYMIRLVNLAQFTAIMRGVVDRDRFSQTVQYRPEYEIGTRLSKQLTKLGLGIAIFLGHKEFGDEEFRIIKKVALDTIPDRFEIILRRMYQSEAGISTSDISALTRLPQATVFKMLQDMDLLKIVARANKSDSKYTWELTPKIKDFIAKSTVYGPPKEPPKHKVLLIKNRR